MMKSMRPLRTHLRVSLLATLSLTCATRATPAVPPSAEPAKPPLEPTVATKPTAAKLPTADQMCRDDGFDFAYSLEETDDMWVPTCGVGPGTPCTAGHCDGSRLFDCHMGKLGLVDCRVYCQEVGDNMGHTYDDGKCRQDRGHAVCSCCNRSEPGCQGPPPAQPPTLATPPTDASDDASPHRATSKPARGQTQRATR